MLFTKTGKLTSALLRKEPVCAGAAGADGSVPLGVAARKPGMRKDTELRKMTQKHVEREKRQNPVKFIESLPKM